jgi:hypothetical protein
MPTTQLELGTAVTVDSQAADLGPKVKKGTFSLLGSVVLGVCWLDGFQRWPLINVNNIRSRTMAWRFRAPPLAALFLFLGAACWLPASAAAVTLNCMPRDAVMERLKETVGEVPQHFGVTANGALFEVTVGPDGNWTAFVSFPDGLTCPLATGEGWRGLAEGDDDPAA